MLTTTIKIIINTSKLQLLIYAIVNSFTPQNSVIYITAFIKMQMRKLRHRERPDDFIQSTYPVRNHSSTRISNIALESQSPHSLPNLLLLSKNQAVSKRFPKHISKQHSPKCHECKRSIHTTKGEERAGSEILTEKEELRAFSGVREDKEKEKFLKKLQLQKQARRLKHQIPHFWWQLEHVHPIHLHSIHCVYISMYSIEEVTCPTSSEDRIDHVLFLTNKVKLRFLGESVDHRPLSYLLCRRWEELYISFEMLTPNN